MQSNSNGFVHIYLVHNIVNNRKGVCVYGGTMQAALRNLHRSAWQRDERDRFRWTGPFARDLRAHGMLAFSVSLLEVVERQHATNRRTELAQEHQCEYNRGSGALAFSHVRAEIVRRRREAEAAEKAERREKRAQLRKQKKTIGTFMKLDELTALRQEAKETPFADDDPRWNRLRELHQWHCERRMKIAATRKRRQIERQSQAAG